MVIWKCPALCCCSLKVFVVLTMMIIDIVADLARSGVFHKELVLRDIAVLVLVMLMMEVLIALDGFSRSLHLSTG
jgi:hypothetical protein